MDDPNDEITAIEINWDFKVVIVGTSSGEIISYLMFEDSFPESNDYKKENKNVVIGEGPFPYLSSDNLKLNFTQKVDKV